MALPNSPGEPLFGKEMGRVKFGWAPQAASTVAGNLGSGERSTDCLPGQ